ncbi:MAG: hypothetical protein OEZ34_07525 [Spirochaetia bacterium]|nr:hypothetical protein [Spirochaetia bacterium]
MRIRFNVQRICFIAGFVFAGFSALSGQTKEEISVEERVSILEDMIENQKLDKAVKKYESYNGMGPAASEVYHSSDGFTFGGYSEIKYKDNKSRYQKDIADVHRLILYTGYRFNDWIIFNGEVEYEHAGFEEKEVVTDVDFDKQESKKSKINGGAVFVEFAYLDFKFNEKLQLSLGMNLVPMGITNYMHEPTTFYSVERPYTETYIIPSTWSEIGGLFHGSFFNKKLNYRTGILTGLKGDDFSDSSWIRGGRQKGSKVEAESAAYVFSLSVDPSESYSFGTGLYRGEVDQKSITGISTARTSFNNINDPFGFEPFIKEEYERKNREQIELNLAEVHYVMNIKNFYSRGLFARGWMHENDVRALNRKTGKNIGIAAEGGYLEAGYNLLGHFKTDQKLVLFIRNEYFNTQKKTVQRYFGGKEDIEDAVCENILLGTCETTDTLKNGNRDLGIIENKDSLKEAYGIKGLPDRRNDRRIMTFGASYFPHPNVSLKIDYEFHNSKTDSFLDFERKGYKTNKENVLNMGIGVIF